jgi:hypothetical protein
VYVCLCFYAFYTAEIGRSCPPSASSAAAVAAAIADATADAAGDDVDDCDDVDDIVGAAGPVQATSIVLMMIMVKSLCYYY